MIRSLVIRRLCWKEFRQLSPLVLMLAAIGLMLHLLFLLSAYNQSSMQNLLFLGLPGLFAAGVGALLVGQERDNRTLYWVASLPILKQDIIRVKFLAGIAGLASVWVVSFALFLLSNGVSSQRIEADFPYYFLYSIFLLFVSFATAWTFRSTFIGLLMLVGVAMSYTLMTQMLTPLKTSDLTSTILLAATSALALWFGWAAGLRALAPAASARFSQRAIEGVSFFDRSTVDYRTIQTPWSALIWQFAAQNRAMLVGLILLFLIPLCVNSMVIGLYGPRGTSVFYQGLPTLGFILCFVSISWLGVVVFQGDNLNQRIRFLSDRGISPRTIWLTRQVIPFGMLVLLTVALAILAACAMSWKQRGGSPTELGLLLLISSCLMWSVYSVTQWMSQVVRSPVIAAIIAPVVGCLPFAYGAFALDTLESPFWILAITNFIPIVATFRMTRHWMDSKMGKRFWLEHGGWLALVILLPAIPFLIVYSTYPSMPQSEWKVFSADAKRFYSYVRQPMEIGLLLSKDPAPVAAITDVETEDASIGGASGGGGSMGMIGGDVEANVLPQNLTLAEESELQWAFIERQLQSVGKTSPVSSSLAGQRLMGEAMMVRAKMQDDGSSEELLKRYQRSIRLIIRIIEGTRITPHLNAQQIADRYEAWLVNELQSKGASEFFGAEMRNAAELQLGDKAGRQNARYRALVIDWVASQNPSQLFKNRKKNWSLTPEHTLGGYSIPTSGNGTRLISKRHVSTVAWRMKQYLMANDIEAMNKAKDALAREWNMTTSEFGLTASTLSIPTTVRRPWTFWFGDWEKQADEYALGSSSSDKR
ncbi:MAG TPA: ABC-2 transporter permease [Pirellula sp.]|nr:ABC-2 transporter permease [Pirellula sp.]